MIVERLHVAGFRRFAEPFEFRPNSRFTVLSAPNGTGKSTLLDALYFGLLERHTVTGEAAKQRFKSLGRDLTPVIEIDFAVAGVRYRLRKVFLANTKSAMLRRFESGHYVAVKDGVAADDFVRELLSAEASGRGAIDADKHLGFAHVLWSPARASFVDVPDSVNDHIRSMLGGSAMSITDGERAVQDLVTDRYYHYFTKDGRLTKAAGSANIPLLQERLNAARDTETAAREHYLRLEGLAMDSSDRQAEAERMKLIRDTLRTEILTARGRVTRYGERKTAAERAARIEGEARAPYERISATIASIDEARRERAALARSRAQTLDELESSLATSRTLSERTVIARRASEDAKAALTEVQRRAGSVSAAQTYIDVSSELDRLTFLRSEYEKATAQLATLSSELGAIVAPTRGELESLQAVSAQVAALADVIATSALAIEIDADADIMVNIIAAAVTGPIAIAGGASATITAADENIIIEIPGLGRIRARGTDGAAAARTSLDSLTRKLDDARVRYGTSVISELADRTERVVDLQRTIRQVQIDARQLLAGRSVDDVNASLAAALQRVTEFIADRPQWETAPPDAGAMRAQFDADLQHVADVAAATQLEHTALEEPKAELDLLIAGLRAKCAVLDASQESLASRLHNLESDEYDDVTRGQRAQKLAIEWGLAKAQSIDAVEKLGEFVENPQNELDRLIDAEHHAGQAYEAALGDARKFEALLETQANLGTYAKLSAAEEHVALCEAALFETNAQAQAVACLHDAFARVQAGRVASVIEPVTKAANRYLTRIAGVTVGAVDITRGLAPSGMIESRSGLRLAIDGTLSSGEKEQIYLATRLALADVLARGRGRQLFVVDDAVTATDPSRLRRFVGLLEELSHTQLQVIVTTADRSRYLGITGAQHIDLGEALLGDSAA